MTWTIDAMAPAATVRVNNNLRAAAQVMVDNTLREVPVLEMAGRIVAFVDEAEVGEAYLGTTAESVDSTSTPHPGSLGAEELRDRLLDRGAAAARGSLASRIGRPTTM